MPRDPARDLREQVGALGMSEPFLALGDHLSHLGGWVLSEIPEIARGIRDAATLTAHPWRAPATLAGLFAGVPAASAGRPGATRKRKAAR